MTFTTWRCSLVRYIISVSIVKMVQNGLNFDRHWRFWTKISKKWMWFDFDLDWKYEHKISILDAKYYTRLAVEIKKMIFFFIIGFFWPLGWKMKLWECVKDDWKYLCTHSSQTGRTDQYILVLFLFSKKRSKTGIKISW